MGVFIPGAAEPSSASQLPASRQQALTYPFAAAYNPNAEVHSPFGQANITAFKCALPPSDVLQRSALPWLTQCFACRFPSAFAECPLGAELSGQRLSKLGCCRPSSQDPR